MKADKILGTAAITLEQRGEEYDSPEGERSMSATVRAFEAVTGVSMTEVQGWLFMAILKAVRSQQGTPHLDSFLDGAAYFALAGESALADHPDEPPKTVYKYPVGKWIENDGDRLGIPPDTEIEVMFQSGMTATGPVKGWNIGQLAWANGPLTIAKWRLA